MTDLSSTILAKSDQLNADDLMVNPITIKITNVTGIDGEQPIRINYENENKKPYYPCKSMRRVLVHVWGADGRAYVGRSLTLYRDPDVTWAGEKIGGIRISHMSHITNTITVPLTSSKAKKKPYTVKPLLTQETVNADALYEDGKVVASKGMDELKSWFEALSVIEKAAIKPNMDELKEIATPKDDGTEAPI